MARALALALLLVALLATSPADAREAFVGNGGSESVSVFDTSTNQVVGSPIPVGLGPFGIAITPDGGTAYVTNIDTGEVKVIDTRTKQVVGSPIMVGGGPEGIAITPDGTRAYVATNGGEKLAVIDTSTNMAGPPIPVGEEPDSVAITPNGSTAYVTNLKSGDVSVVDIRTNQVVGSPIDVGANPRGIAVTPDGSRAYVANHGTDTVSVIDTATNQVVGSPIGVGHEPDAVAITPDGTRAYVTNLEAATISVIDTATNQVVGSPIEVNSEPTAIAITPDGTRAYATNRITGEISVIDTASNQVVGSPIAIGKAPEAIAISPDQAPIAAFTSSTPRPGVPASFDATGSRDAEGSIGRYEWNFGDGSAAPNGGPTPQHTYRRPGRYRVTVTLTDNEGCSTSLRFTGQTAYCNGSARASQTEFVSVAYPAVRVRCPKRAKPKGCKFKLAAVTKRRRGKAMTQVARTKVSAGRSKVVSLKTKPRFATRIGTASKVLIRESVTIGGSSKKRFVRLPIVPQAG